LNAQHENGKAFGRNDLQPVAQALCPSIAQVAHWLEARFGNSRMTGSGSAVFATVGADGVSWPEGDLPPGWNGRMCRSLAHHPLRAWAD
jgi:4-diphosphocytidyl-2-C-methyl-D-erythritol kinase